MGLEDNGFLGLHDANDQDDMYHTTFPVMPRYTIQESNVGALYLDNGPWITQNMDIAQPPPKDAFTQSPNFEFALSGNSRVPTLPTTRVNLPPPSIRQRTAQACDKCRERKTKCSGHRPVCLRCMTRGLICEYSARETRLRLPTQSRFHPAHIRPVSDPEAIMQQVNYQPARLVDFHEPKPVYLGHPTMAFSSGDHCPEGWARDGCQQGPFAYGDQTIVAPCDTTLSVGSPIPFSLSQVDCKRVNNRY